MKILALIMLLICSYTDLKYRKISLVILGGFSLLGVIAACVLYGSEWMCDYKVIINPLLGILLYFFSRIFGGLGEGDALIIIVTGCLLGAFYNCLVFMMATLISGIYALFLFMRDHDKGKTFPFVPFITAADIVVMIYERM